MQQFLKDSIEFTLQGFLLFMGIIGLLDSEPGIILVSWGLLAMWLINKYSRD